MGRDAGPAAIGDGLLISIHSPRMGRDLRRSIRALSSSQISIHSPRMGRDRRKATRRLPLSLFQSTLPAWGETTPSTAPVSPRDFNPLSPHGERRWTNGTPSATGSFQSTLPAWGETLIVLVVDPSPAVISIHSPRMGRDQLPRLQRIAFDNISIHSPRMGRDCLPVHCMFV